MDHQGLQTPPNSFWELSIGKLSMLHSVALDSKNPLPGKDLGAPLLTDELFVLWAPTLNEAKV